MPSARASRCSSRGRWTAFPSATGADRRADRRKGIVAAGGRPRAEVPIGRAEALAAADDRESRRRASRGWVELAGVRG
jgi:hypothetical protein